MKTIQVYDKPMCCSSGVCGAEVDPVLPRFAADLDWLKSQGHTVERFNLAQQPSAFIQHPQVLQLVTMFGTSCLPLVVIDGRIATRAEYPRRERLASLLDSAALEVADVGSEGSCCGGSKCC